MDGVRAHVADGRVLALLEGFLQQGAMDAMDAKRRSGAAPAENAGGRHD